MMAEPPTIKPSDDELLVTFLSERDFMCPRCGYNLRNITSGACPECGDLVTLGVVLADPKIGPYLVLLLAAGTGFGGSLGIGLLALSAGAFPHWLGEFSGQLLLVMLLLFGLELGCIIRYRLRIRRWEDGRQLRAGQISWVVLIVLSTIFFFTFDS